MENKIRVKRVVLIGAIVAGSTLAAVPSLTSATSVEPAAATTTAAGTTTTTVKPTTTTVKTTTGATVAPKNYEVVAGIYTTHAKATAHIEALTKAKFTGFTIKKVNAKFAVVKASLTKAQAKQLAKRITGKKILGSARVKKLA